jgi:hypothetical protein
MYNFNKLPYFDKAIRESNEYFECAYCVYFDVCFEKHLEAKRAGGKSEFNVE